MLLAITNNVANLLKTIEAYPTVVGLAVTLITALLFGRKYLWHKRSEAFYGFYSKLYLLMKELRVLLDEDGMLNCEKTSDKGNIFTRLYTKDTRQQFCRAFPIENIVRYDLYKDVAKKIVDLLMNTEVNVYPKGADSWMWYQSQFVLYSFCIFLENEACQEITNKMYDDGDDNDKADAKHIKKCKELVMAMEYLEKSIVFSDELWLYIALHQQ